MKYVAIMPIGTVESPILTAAADIIREATGRDARIMTAVGMPQEALDGNRGQHEALAFLRALLQSAPQDAERVLGVTSVDLFIPMLTFVFGQAQLGGRVAVMSVARLRQEYYGLPANDRLLESRAKKEALHEIGHTFGLTHCSEPSCAMMLSNSIQQVDAKPSRLCDGCDLLIHEQRTESN